MADIGIIDRLFYGTFRDVDQIPVDAVLGSPLAIEYDCCPDPCVVFAWEFLGDHNLKSSGALFYLCTAITFLSWLQEVWKEIAMEYGFEYGDNHVLAVSVLQLSKFTAYIKGFVILPNYQADGQRGDEEKRFYLSAEDDMQRYIPSLSLCVRLLVTFVWHIVGTVGDLERDTSVREKMSRMVGRLPQKEFSNLFHSLARGRITEKHLDQMLCDNICKTFAVTTDIEARYHPCYMSFFKPATEILRKGVPQCFLDPLSLEKTSSATCKHRSAKTSTVVMLDISNSPRTCTHCVEELQRVLVESIAELDKLNRLASHVHHYSYQLIDLLEANWRPIYCWQSSRVLLSAVPNLLLFRLDRLVHALSWYVFHLDIDFESIFTPDFEQFVLMDNTILTIATECRLDAPCAEDPTSVGQYLQRTFAIWNREIKRNLGLYRYLLGQFHEDVAKFRNKT